MVARLSVSEPFVFAAALLFGPAAGTATVAIDACVMSLRLMPSLRTPHRVLFNVGTLVLSVASSSWVFFILSGIDPRAPEYPSVDSFIWPLYAFSACCFFVNSGLVALALSVERKSSPVTIWREQFMWLSVNYFAGASVAALIVVFARTVDVAILGIVIPLIAISYLTFRTTLGRLDDANKHLGDLNSLYLSTIETLAMAIDAKDQVTHSHIRRVQRYATGLARALGIQNEKQVKAIEAAALLHDMGKLAIPEFILNKPGKLTSREFSVMKTHAAVGADLLSSIRFPYPVVPIVRHHHENWDGSGYPDGLRGPAIPIGARILAVVDCYDALTSHRPYRPALSASQALEILTQRRGKMYDPLVVDAFVREHASLSTQAELQDFPTVLLATQADATPEPIDDKLEQQDTPIESLRLLASVSAFPGGPPTRVVCRQLVDSLHALVPFDTAAVFVLSEASSDAEVLYVDGSAAHVLTGQRIPIAERLTGWVAAHRTAVWNSDARLDLGPMNASTTLSLGSSLPLYQNETLFGVLSLYGRPEHEITVGQRRALESLLPILSAHIGDSLARPGTAIDCTAPQPREAALSALESLLSHNRRSSSEDAVAIVAVAMSALVSDGAPQNSLEAATRTLAVRLSPTVASKRCVLKIADGHLLLCGLDSVDATELEQEVLTAAKVSALQPFAISSTPIRTPLELQDRVRRALELASTVQTVRASRVH
ncbi:MAG: HD domain-containing protein [Vicinamibacterales bacterium]